MIGNVRRPLLCSYPRSGLNWLCNAFERVTGCRSDGHVRVVRGKMPQAFYRQHAALHPEAQYYLRIGLLNSVLLLIRDPAISFTRRTSCNHPFKVYTQNIKFFDRCRLPKKLVYYEELLTKQGIYDIVAWMGYPCIPFKNFEQAKIDSKVDYCRNKHPDYPRIPPTPADTRKAHRLCLQRLGKDLARRYLGRYMSVPD